MLTLLLKGSAILKLQMGDRLAENGHAVMAITSRSLRIRMILAIHPPHDPDEALIDQLEMIKHLKEKESYEFMKYSDLLSLESSSSI
jgi:hypothetical protein